jgi:two-component system cell cycle sensor histidine kinase/response regulator CckA
MRGILNSVSSRVKSYLHPQPERVPRILVVDDEVPILGFGRRVLEAAGYEIVIAENGRQALELAGEKGPFDALVTDLVMPHMTGDELARRLRSTSPDLKILYLTGFCDQLFKEKVTLWDDEAFLEKPTSIDGLQQAVALLLYRNLNSFMIGGAPSRSAEPA